MKTNKARLQYNKYKIQLDENSHYSVCIMCSYKRMSDHKKDRYCCKPTGGHVKNCSFT